MHEGKASTQLDVFHLAVVPLLQDLEQLHVLVLVRLQTKTGWKSGFTTRAGVAATEAEEVRAHTRKTMSNERGELVEV